MSRKAKIILSAILCIPVLGFMIFAGVQQMSGALAVGDAMYRMLLVMYFAAVIPVFIIAFLLASILKQQKYRKPIRIAASVWLGIFTLSIAAMFYFYYVNTH